MPVRSQRRLRTRSKSSRSKRRQSIKRARKSSQKRRRLSGGTCARKRKRKCGKRKNKNVYNMIALCRACDGNLDRSWRIDTNPRLNFERADLIKVITDYNKTKGADSLELPFDTKVLLSAMFRLKLAVRNKLLQGSVRQGLIDSLSEKSLLNSQHAEGDVKNAECNVSAEAAETSETSETMPLMEGLMEGRDSILHMPLMEGVMEGRDGILHGHPTQTFFVSPKNAKMMDTE